MDESVRPADRLSELPEETRKFLAELDEKDVATLRDGLGLIRSLMTVGRFSKWVIVTLVGIFLGGVMVVDGVQKVWAWIQPRLPEENLIIFRSDFMAAKAKPLGTGPV